MFMLAILVSILLSLWRIYGNDLINQDAVHYLQAAAGDSASASRLNNWLFYSWSIRWVSDTLSMELLAAAYLLNIFLSAVLIYAFLRVVELFNGNTRTLFWAAVVILSLPYLNENRAEIIRGHGYWAFSMLGFIYYIRLFRNFSWLNLAGWSISMLFAVLFRIEGLVLLSMAPLGLLLNTRIPWRDRWNSLAKSYVPLVVAAVLLVLTYFLLEPFQNRLLEVFQSAGALVDTLLHKIPHKAEMLRQYVFPRFSGEGAVFSVYLILLFMILKDFIESLSLPYFLLLLFRRTFPAVGIAVDARPIIGFFIAANFMLLIPYIMLHFVMVSRYTLMASLLLLIIVAFSLAGLQERKSTQEARKYKILFNIMLLVIALMFIAGMTSSGSNKLYVLDAARWMQNNLPAGTHVGTDYQKDRLGYYANYAGENRHTEKPLRVHDISNKKIKMPEYEYFMLRVKSGELVTKTPSGSWVLEHADKIHELLDKRDNGYFVYRSTY